MVITKLRYNDKKTLQKKVVNSSFYLTSHICYCLQITLLATLSVLWYVVPFIHQHLKIPFKYTPVCYINGRHIHLLLGHQGVCLGDKSGLGSCIQWESVQSAREQIKYDPLPISIFELQESVTYSIFEINHSLWQNKFNFTRDIDHFI